uniref:F-box domain-containing protein n=1 Tax=Brassica oleracea TaxID=3712 RepID=A0A3P6CIA6_BRAOL|nr:unnamed protein product [Brassica oleracea]
MDRVSNLPDELLCYVLSFLPTKNAALTSVLSKRWFNLWKLVPNLDINDSLFLHPQDGKGERQEIQRSFVDFVDRVLAMQGDSPINNFSLKCITGRVHPDIVNRWICNVLKRGVSDLSLYTHFAKDLDDYLYRLPKEMFVKLSLRNERCVDWYFRDMGSSLPMLKSLDINSDTIVCGEFEKFITSFPMLEELEMGTMKWEDFNVTVSSANLRSLSLHGSGIEGWDDFENPKSFSFDAPNLLFLNYSELVPEDYPVVNMGKLLEAHINLMVTDEQMKRVREPNHDLLEGDDEGDVVLHFGNVVKLINGIENVQTLSLTSDTLEVSFCILLSRLCCDSMPVFNNLKFLSVTSEEGRGWQAMPALLRNYPHLETIIIQGLLHYVTDECGDACPCISREDRGRSLRSCPVKRLEIQGFRGTMKEMNMIKHFLDYFPCLKRLDVFVEDNDPTQLRNDQVSELVIEMFELYSKLWPSFNVKLLVSDFLDEKWTAQGHI